MKRLFSIFAALLVALSVSANPLILLSGSPPDAGSGFTAITADLWETFEFTDPPDATKLNGADGNASAAWAISGGAISTTANQASPAQVNATTDTGTRGIVLNNNAGDGQSVDLNSYPTTQSTGFWFYVSALDATSFVRVSGLGENLGMAFGGGSQIAIMCVDRNGGSTYTAALWSAFRAGSSSSITISAATWYWATIKFISNGTCSMKIYDASGAIVGAEVTIAGGNFNAFYHSFGTGSSATGELRMDNIVINSSTGAYPLGHN